jgi:hypothetical protein
MLLFTCLKRNRLQQLEILQQQGFSRVEVKEEILRINDILENPQLIDETNKVFSNRSP